MAQNGSPPKRSPFQQEAPPVSPAQARVSRAVEMSESTRLIVWYLRRLMQAGAHYSKQLARDHNISQPQLSCLVSLVENGSMPLSGLARSVMVNPSTLTGIIDRLESKGLVRRVRDSADRRKIRIELTSQGRRAADSAPPPIHQSIIDGLGELTPNQTKTIVKSLASLVDMLDR